MAWLFIMVSVGRITELLPGLGHIPLAKIAAAIWLIAIVTRPKPKTSPMPPLLSIPMVKVALAILILAMVSIAFSILWRGSVNYLLGPGAVVALAFALLCATARSYEFVIATLRCLLATATLLAFCAIMFSSGGRIAAGISYDTNDLAYVLVTTVPISIAFWMTSKGRAKVIYGAIMAMLVIAVLLTQSRGGALSLTAIILMLIFTDLKPADSKTGSASFGTRISRLLVIMIIGALTWTQLPSETKERLGTLVSLESDYNMDTSITQGRSSIWKRNFNAVVERPIGFGIGAFMAVDGRTGGKWMAPHNSLLQITVELGFIGAILYLTLYVTAWRALGRKAEAARSTNDVQREVFSRALRIALVSNFIGAFFLSMAYSSMLWVLFATIIIFLNVDAPQPEPAEAGRQSKLGLRAKRGPLLRKTLPGAQR